MNTTFLSYILLFLPIVVFFIWLSKDRVLKDEPTYAEYALAILFTLLAWDELALQLRHWYYPAESNLGIYIGRHPLEIIVSGLLFPLFIISVWEFVKHRR